MKLDGSKILQFRRPPAAMLLTALALATPSCSAWAYDFSEASRLPLQHRPDTEASKRISDSHSLVRAMHTDRHLFFRLRLLLPARFRLAQGEQFQSIIDDAVLELSKSEAGKKAICPFAVDREKDVQMYFATSAQAARKIRITCRDYPKNSALTSRLRFMREAHPPFYPEPRLPAKKFVLIFNEAGSTEIEGYTAKSNVTYLVLTKETMKTDLVRRMIAHELAISYDQLGRFGYIIDPTTLENSGTGLAFGLPPGDRVLEEIPVKEVQRLQCAFRDPALRFAAAAHRAFIFEDLAYPKSTPVAAQGSCRQILAKNSVLLQVMARTVAWDNQAYAILCGDMATEASARLRQVLDRINTIEAKTLRCTSREACGGRDEIRLCELLLNPRVGPNERDLESGGPRPRMGGWGNRENHDSSLMERAANGEQLTPNEVRQLGGRLRMPNSLDELYEEEDRRGGR